MLSILYTYSFLAHVEFTFLGCSSHSSRVRPVKGNLVYIWEFAIRVTFKVNYHIQSNHKPINWYCMSYLHSAQWLLMFKPDYLWISECIWRVCAVFKRHYELPGHTSNLHYSLTFTVDPAQITSRCSWVSCTENHGSWFPTTCSQRWLLQGLSLIPSDSSREHYIFIWNH